LLGFDREIAAVITDLEMFKKTVEKAEPGDQLGILLRGPSLKDIRRGLVLVPAEHTHKITDKVKAQIYVLKPDEGGSRIPIANYIIERVFSLTWDVSSVLMIEKLIMPGEHGE
jgi:elongation factor Tu